MKSARRVHAPVSSLQGLTDFCSSDIWPPVPSQAFPGAGACGPSTRPARLLLPSGLMEAPRRRRLSAPAALAVADLESALRTWVHRAGTRDIGGLVGAWRPHGGWKQAPHAATMALAAQAGQ